MMAMPLASAQASTRSGAPVATRIGPATVDVDHDGTAPAPLELLAGALASCSAMAARTQLEKQGEKGDVEVVVTLDAGPPTLFYRRVLLPFRPRPADAHDLVTALERTEVTEMLRPSFEIRTVVEHEGEPLT